MADIKQLIGTNRNVLTSSGYSARKYLYAQYGYSVYDVLTNTGTPINIGDDFYGSDITPDTDSTFEIYNDKLVHSNLYGPNAIIDLTDETYTWKNTDKMPYCKYLKTWNSRLYGGYCRLPVLNIKKYLQNLGAIFKLNLLDKINPVFKNRVFYSELPTADNKILWGLDYGSWLYYTGSTDHFIFNKLLNFSYQPYLKHNKIKVGDPFYVYDGTASVPYKQYTIKEIIGEQSLDLTEGIALGLNASSYWFAYEAMPWWAGSNWFDIPEPDDEITGMEATKEELLIFLFHSLYSYNTSSLRKISSIGTSSNKSIKTIGKLTIFFHGSTKEKTGFYLYNGVSITRISQKVQPFIDAITTANFDNVVAWTEGNLYRAYIGDLSNVNSSNNLFNISMTNAVFTFDLSNNNMVIEPIADKIVSSGTLTETNQKNTLIGTDSDQVMDTPSGYAYDDSSIHSYSVIGPIFPRGTLVKNVFTRIRLLTRDAHEYSVKYSLVKNLDMVDQEWTSIGSIKNNIGELDIPTSNNVGLGIYISIDNFEKTESNGQIYELKVGSYEDSTTSPEKT